MRAGPNRYRITIQEKSVTYNSVGEEVETWTALGVYWARKFVRSAREQLSQQVETAITLTEFQLRNPRSVAISPAMRVLWSGHTYNIREVLPTGKADKDLLLTCTEVL